MYKNEENFHQINLQGLFSRITFREPVFLGGTGNITGLAKRLPVYDGMTGCIRKFIANEHEYIFAMTPTGDATKGFDVRKYIFTQFLLLVLFSLHSYIFIFLLLCKSKPSYIILLENISANKF